MAVLPATMSSSPRVATAARSLKERPPRSFRVAEAADTAFHAPISVPDSREGPWAARCERLSVATEALAARGMGEYSLLTWRSWPLNCKGTQITVPRPETLDRHLKKSCPSSHPPAEGGGDEPAPFRYPGVSRRHAPAQLAFFPS